MSTATLPAAALLALLAPVVPAPQSPVAPMRVLAPFQAPAHAFGPGHRGVDLAADLGQKVMSPIHGTVSFRGTIAGRAVISIADGNRVFSLEPVLSQLPIGTVVDAGQSLGRVGIGGHCSLRCVHLGLRVDGIYQQPLRLHARLLP